VLADGRPHRGHSGLSAGGDGSARDRRGRARQRAAERGGLVGARTVLIGVGGVVLILAGALAFPVKLAHVQLPAEAIGHICPFTITNSILAGWISSLVVLWVFWAGTSRATMVPSGIQNFVEFSSEFILGLCESVAGLRRGREFFPIIATIFFFVIVSNWMGL